MSELTCKVDFYDIRIYVDGHLHLYIKRDQLIAFQSWKDSSTQFLIQFTLKDGSVKSEYADSGIWYKILALLDKHIKGC